MEWIIWCEDLEDKDYGVESIEEDLFENAQKYAHKKIEKDFELKGLRCIAENTITKQRRYFSFEREISWYVCGIEINKDSYNKSWY